MKLTTAKKDYICRVCSATIKMDEEYWSSPYKSLCLPCGVKINLGKLKYSQTVGSYVDTMDAKGQSGVKCKNPSKGIWAGKPVGDGHMVTIVED